MTFSGLRRDESPAKPITVSNNQSEIEEKLCIRRQARENGFGFASDWSEKLSPRSDWFIVAVARVFCSKYRT